MELIPIHKRVHFASYSEEDMTDAAQNTPQTNSLAVPGIQRLLEEQICGEIWSSCA